MTIEGEAALLLFFSDLFVHLPVEVLLLRGLHGGVLLLVEVVVFLEEVISHGQKRAIAVGSDGRPHVGFLVRADNLANRGAHFD